MKDSLVARARVLAVHADGGVTLSVDGARACPGCQCGRWLQSEQSPFDFYPAEDLTLRPGNELLVLTPAADILRGAVWLHGLPWSLTLLGGAAAWSAGFGDLGCLAGMAAGLATALLALRATRHRWKSLLADALASGRRP